MAFVLILLPLAMAGLAALIPSNRWRPLLLPVLGTAHLTLTVLVMALPQLNIDYDWLTLDPLGKIALLSLSSLFFFCSYYTVGYLRLRQERSNRIFTMCMSGFLGLASLVVQTHHLGLMWVAMEGTTLITAPLIYFNRTKLSIEATWKYLLVGSVGIALALLGTFFLAYSGMEGGMEASLSFDQLLYMAPHLAKPWFRAAFVLLLVGYGTKMGLAPMHSWKPDTYGESSGVVGAIFAGGVTTAAFLAFLRVYQIGLAAGEGPFMSHILLAMGLLSMLVAGMFMIGQRDFKRMLAYSSVEHMGILVLGLGIGKLAFFGTILHIVNNSLTKGVLFLAAGNIQRAFGGKHTDQVRGALQRVPVSGTLFLLGFLAITGSPPFAPFVSEFSILGAAFGSGQNLVAGLFLFLLLLIFIGMGNTVLKVVQGRVPAGQTILPYREGLLTIAPALLMMAIILLMGLYIPIPLRTLLDQAVSFLGAQS